MKRVLVVDDEKEVLYVFERVLEQMGHESVVCDSWETALEQFYDEAFDLVILDVHMPGRDGFQIAKEMRSAKPKQRIMIVTGLDAGQAFSYFQAAGVDVNEILYKPFSIPKVKNLITKVMDSPEE